MSSGIVIGFTFVKTLTNNNPIFIDYYCTDWNITSR